MNEPIPRRRRHPHHVCIDCGFEWDGITAAPVAGEGLDVAFLERVAGLRECMAGLDGSVHLDHVRLVADEAAAALAADQPVAEERTP